MKCPSCGAECTSKFCEYCGSEMPVQVAPVNITNNYYTTQPDASKASCPKCGCAFVKFERERNSNMVRTVGLCQGCGYTWFPNEGQQDTSYAPPSYTVPVGSEEPVDNGFFAGFSPFIWLLGFFFCFPGAVTAFILSRKSLPGGLKVALIILAWMLMAIVLSARRRML
ncbi:MAG: hypothetical protein IKZ90_09940 [Clostridiales bacterium]|nr:hypothetical protein [Clostridiales bacterium]